VSWQQWFVAIWIAYGLVSGIVAPIKATRAVRDDSIAAVAAMVGVLVALGLTAAIVGVLHSGGFW
jgi:hypothetical protein